MIFGQIPFHYNQKEINYKKGYLFAESTLQTVENH